MIAQFPIGRFVAQLAARGVGTFAPPPGYLPKDNGPPEHVPSLASVLRVDENGYCYLSFHRYFESVA